MPDLSLNPNIGTQRAPRVSPYPDASLYLDFLTMSANFMDSRITFSRGTNATLTDSTGRITYAPANLLLRSQEFDNAAWAKDACTISANAAVAPDGTTTADKIVSNNTTTQIGIGQTFTAIATNYTASFYAKAAEVQFVQILWTSTRSTDYANFDLVNGTVTASVGSATITSVGNGWYRITLTSSLSAGAGAAYCWMIGSGSAVRATAYAGNGTNGYLGWGAQLEPVTYQTVPSTYVATAASAYYGPRFDYDPVTLAPRGLLIEEQRTNLVLRSEEFDNAVWAKSIATITANYAASPDGTADADRFVSAGGSFPQIAQSVTVSTGDHTVSIYVKSDGTSQIQQTILFDGSSVTFTPTDTWTRVTLTKNVTVSGAKSVVIATNSASAAASSFLIWGAQLEAGAFATSYIPTVASTVTRNADVATMTGTNFSAWYNQSEGTFVMSLTPRGVPTGGANVRFLEVNDGTATNRNPLMYASSAGTTYTQYRVAGADQANLGSAAGYYAANSTITIGAAYAANDFATSFSGGAVQTDTSGSVVTNASELDIGYARSAAGTEVFCGHIRTIAYFNTRQPNAQLQTLTAPALVPSLSLDFINNVYNVGF